MITPAHAFFNWAIFRKWLPPWWVVGGSVLPDLPSYLASSYLVATNGLDFGGDIHFGFLAPNGNPNRQPGSMEAGFLLHALPLFAVLAGWGLHIAADLLTHVEDAYAPLYPFLADWNPEYGADTFRIAQAVAVALVLAWLLAERLWKTRKARRRGEGAGR